jgi:cation diffusion facilitator CzcD-associated flavoprotein CzcO
LLETTLNKFPTGTEDFVSHQVLKDYIQDTAAKMKVDEITQYNTEVKDVTKNGEKWTVKTTSLQLAENGETLRANKVSVSRTMTSQYVFKRLSLTTTGI